MAEKQQADQFAYWNAALLASNNEVAEALAAKPLDIDQLTTALDGLAIDLQNVTKFEQTSKKVSYDYTEALPNVSKALRQQQRAARLLGTNDSD